MQSPQPPVRDVVEQHWPEHDEEVRRLNLQYRNRLEFAIGRTCSADWVTRDGARRASEVSTTWLPSASKPPTVPGATTTAVAGTTEPRKPPRRAITHARTNQRLAFLSPLTTSPVLEVLWWGRVHCGSLQAP